MKQEKPLVQGRKQGLNSEIDSEGLSHVQQPCHRERSNNHRELTRAAGWQALTVTRPVELSDRDTAQIGSVTSYCVTLRSGDAITGS